MNATWTEAIHTTAGGFCKAYGQTYLSVLQHPTRFGSFSSPQRATTYEGVRTMFLGLPLFIMSLVSIPDFLPYTSPSVRNYVKGLRFLEPAVYFLFGVADAILTFESYDARASAYDNLSAWYWFTMNMVLIVNSVIQVACIQWQYSRPNNNSNSSPVFGTLTKMIDSNWIIFGLLLLLQTEGTWTGALLRMLAGFAVILATLVFSPSSQRYVNPNKDKSILARAMTAFWYFLQMIAAALICFSYLASSGPPLHIIVPNARGSPYWILLVLLWTCLSGEIVAALPLVAF